MCGGSGGSGGGSGGGPSGHGGGDGLCTSHHQPRRGVRITSTITVLAKRTEIRLN